MKRLSYMIEATRWSGVTIDDPETYRRVQVEQARLVASTANDMVNTNVAFTVGEISEDVTVMTTANFTASVDILELAGSNHVVQLGQEMGRPWPAASRAGIRWPIPLAPLTAW
jgi:hypothetical protein